MGFYDSGVEFSIRRLHDLTNLNAYGLSWAEDHMADMGQRADTYPGDESVSVDYTEAMRYDPKGMAFPKLAIRVVLATAQLAGANITPTVYEDVKRMAVGPEATDTYLDDVGDDPEERQRRHEVVIRAVDDCVTNLQPSNDSEDLRNEAPLIYGGLRYYGNALHTMSVKSRQAIGRHAVDMLGISLQKSQERDLARYAKLAYQEGRHYGHMWAETVWARQPAESRAEFEKYDLWIAEMLGGMLLASSGMDMGRDSRNHEIVLSPSFADNLYLTLKGCKKMLKVAAPLVRLISTRNSRRNLATQPGV